MGLKIKRYEKTDKDALFDLICSEGMEWADYSGNNKAVKKYKIALDNCIVYVLTTAARCAALSGQGTITAMAYIFMICLCIKITAETLMGGF